MFTIIDSSRSEKLIKTLADQEQTRHTAIIKEAQPKKIYTEQFLYLDTDVNILVICRATLFREVDRCLCSSPINLTLFHEICKNS